ncbi:MAG: hypothetical protein FWD56_06250 [Bacteroidales bacterium]|nr:hypothetical protein [Bacteroidales bacterium]
MNTDFKTSFLNDVKKVKDKSLLPKVKQTILDIEKAASKQDIPGLRKLKGGKKRNYYRIKIDNFRIGVTIDDDLVTLVVFMPRKDIYKFFP